MSAAVRTPTKSRLWLALSGVLDAIISVCYLILHAMEERLTFHSWNGMIVLLGQLTLAAGACRIAAGWRSAGGQRRLLILNGLALGALGLIQYRFTRFPISLATVAFLAALMATSGGLLELWPVRTQRPHLHAGEAWFLCLSGAVLIGFALGFLAVALGWIRIGPGSRADLLWLGSYFGFSAVCMVWAALRLSGQASRS